MTRRPDDRTPPHDLTAEEAVLGAALLAQTAAATLTATLAPADFYKPAHRHIAEAIIAVQSHGDPVDTVTVAAQLRASRTLAEAGGPEALHGLQNATPAISAAAHYAGIVRDAAQLRRLLYLSSDIAEAVYQTPDLAAAMARVSGLVDGLAKLDAADLSTLEVADIAALLEHDLEPEQGAYFARTDGVALIYAGKTHTFQAEPSSGKTWLGLHLVCEALDMGGTALVIDWEDTARGHLRRLLALGQKPEVLAERFRYVQPVGPLTPAELQRLDRTVAELNPDVIVIDSVAAAMGRDGLDENDAGDYIRWYGKLADPLARTGAAVVLVDHVAKDPEQRGRYARGSGAKLGATTGAAYQVKVIEAFSRHRPGRVKMVVAKDRPGQFTIGETAAIIDITPHAGGERVTVAVTPNVEETRTGDPWKPTHLMASVASLLASSSVPLTAAGVKSALPRSKPKMVAEAITRLITEGYVAQASGRTKTLTVLRPYVDPEARPRYDEPPAPPPPTDADYSDATLFADI